MRNSSIVLLTFIGQAALLLACGDGEVGFTAAHGFGGSAGTGGFPSENGGGIPNGGSGGSGSGGIGGGDSCERVTANTIRGSFSSADGLGSYSAVIAPNVMGSGADSLRLLVKSVTAGTFQLDSEENSDPKTCTHCLYAYVDFSESGAFRLFWQKSGSISIRSSSTDIQNGLIDATLVDVTLVEVVSTAGGFVEVGGAACLKMVNEDFSIAAINGWTCQPGVFDAVDGCHCGCGIWDPDCEGDGVVVWGCQYAVPMCVNSNGQGVCEDAEPQWWCGPDSFGMRDGCQCECGLWDPDCGSVSANVYGCESVGATCVNVAGQGECKNRTLSWSCHPDYYDSGDGCDCECGRWDPDCDIGNSPAAGCMPGVACENADGVGVCEGNARWSCLGIYYSDEACDCNCGGWDAACEDPGALVFGCNVPGMSCFQDADGKPYCG